MGGGDLFAGLLSKASLRVRRLPRRSEERPFERTYSLQLTSRIPDVSGQRAIEREIALGAFDDGPVIHDSRVAHGTTENPQLDLALFPHDVPVERQHAIACHWRSGLFEPPCV